MKTPDWEVVMSPLFQSRRVWLGLMLGALGAVRIWAMAATGVAAFPHVMAALTVLVPAVLFGVVMRSAWPGAAGLLVVLIIELSLT